MRPHPQCSKCLVFQSRGLSHHAGAVQIKIEVDLISEVVVVVAHDAGGGEEVLNDALGGFFCCRDESAGRYVYRKQGRNIPGVFRSRRCGMWNCMVFGGDWSKASRLESSTVSSQTLAVDLMGVLFFAKRWATGVRTDTPGVRVGLRCGEEKISAWSSGAAGSGEDRIESSAMY